MLELIMMNEEKRRALKYGGIIFGSDVIFLSGIPSSKKRCEK